ncbi:NADP-dependent oxidoreductase domain-containing protein [Flagelloscypha sp. PMI_526]|nr:NADP-dependent oxidoreductase domain-containing protein [Flagelloscypha sp. PMI_526]
MSAQDLTSKQAAQFFAPLPAPESPLAHWRLLSPNASIHVSPLQLGAMSIGDKWEQIGMGSMNKDSSFELLDAFFAAGGNFIDTANNYQDETSEKFVGEWMESRGIRDQIVVATKYTSAWKRRDPSIQQKVFYTGNSAKALHISVEASLKKLRTDYIDILYVHWWDYATTVREVMDSLHTLVTARKVLYLGISDAPAWVVSQCNEYALQTHKTPFVIYQGAWNVLSRDFERDIIPMARAHGMALAPWNVLAAGKFRSSKEEREREESGEGGRKFLGDWRKGDSEKKVTDKLEEIAKEFGDDVDPTAVAIAYVMHKAPYVFPIIGGRKVAHLKSNIKALEIALTKEHIAALESLTPFNPGFPHFLIGNGSDYSPTWKSTVYTAPKPVLNGVPHGKSG